MQENKTIMISKEQLEKMLGQYYNDSDISVIIETKKELRGYCSQEYYEAETIIKLKKQVNLCGVRTEIIEELDENDVKEIIVPQLEDIGYEMVYFEMLNRLDTVSVGYYMNEHIEEVPVFNGLKLTVKDIKRKKLVR